MRKRTVDLVGRMEALGACKGARRWVCENHFISAQQAWEACDNVEWMLWVVRSLVTNRDTVRAVEGIAETQRVCRIRGDVIFGETDYVEAIRLVMPRPPRPTNAADFEDIPF